MQRFARLKWNNAIINQRIIRFGPRSASAPAIAGLASLVGLSLMLVSSTARAADDSATTSKTILNSLQNAFTNIAEELEPTVVTVSSSKSLTPPSDATDTPRNGFPPGRMFRRATGTGSGVIIRKDGWILTNDHVVGGADHVTVKMHDGREFSGRVVRDHRSDLALVKIESPTPFPAARLGDSDKTQIGFWAIAIGSPYRYAGSLSVGVISSLHRLQTIPDPDSKGNQRVYLDMIQTDAAINPGNSGGPLINLNGEVIGINTAIESESGGSVGIGFAIPVNAVKFVVEQLLSSGKVSYGYLGVQPKDVTPRMAAAFGVGEGALVGQEPLSDSPAAKAGLHAGDVITALNGKAIRSELELRTSVLHSKPRTNVEFSIYRDGKPSTIKVLLEEALDTDSEPIKPRDANKPQLGLEVIALTTSLANISGVSPKTNGVYIKSIDPASSAAEVDDLQEKSVITRVNNTSIANIDIYREIISHLKTGDMVRITFQNLRGKYVRAVLVD